MCKEARVEPHCVGPETICYIKSQSNYFCEIYFFLNNHKYMRLTRSDFTSLYSAPLHATQSCVQFQRRKILRAWETWEKSMRASRLPQLDQTSLGVVDVR